MYKNLYNKRGIEPKNIESPFELNELFFSITDPKGVILTGNDVFVKVSKMSKEELIGKPHNIIRHPDMPRAIFKALWSTIKAGRPFVGYVKNMAKDGSYYWVLAAVYPVMDENGEIEKYISDILGYEVELKEDTFRGFPDDLEAYGPTVVARPTIIEVGKWFNINEEESRLRFRTNLELDGENLPPFWEDRLYSKKGEVVWFRIGDVKIGGVNPCRRCPIPTRNPLTGEELKEFKKRFEELRKKTLPPWAERSRFDTYYRLTVNTIIPQTEAGKILRAGAKFELLGKK